MIYLSLLRITFLNKSKNKNMKKVILSLAIVATLMVSVTSCSKCVKCRVLGITYGKVCAKDFATDAEYQAAAQLLRDTYLCL